MAVFSGHTGAVSFGGYYDLNVTSWTLTYTADVHDITELGDADRSFVGGLRTVTGTIEGYAENGGTVEVPGGAAASAVFTMGNADTFTVNIIITSAEWTTGIDGPDRVRASFQGSGDLVSASA